jgi:hypothetical protein
MPKAPDNLRNGMKWRGGRPRWEPSPANRSAGIRGHDIKDLSGNWIVDRGRAITIADLRHTWAQTYREALRDDAKGESVRLALSEALVKLSPPRDDEARLNRAAVADIIEKCRALIEARPEVAIKRTGGRTVSAMIDAYFRYQDDPATSERAENTIIAYKQQAKRIRQKFGDHGVDEVTRPMVYEWYKALKAETSLTTAQSAMGAMGAIFRWGTRHEGWNKETPVTGLGLEKPEGRCVAWPFQLEKDFVAFCDANGFEDVGDAITLGCWTAASQVDMCKTLISTLSSDIWRYRRQKTKLEAVAGILPQVAARVQRRRNAATKDGVKYMKPDMAPFLFDPETRTAHSSGSIGKRFLEARKLAIVEAYTNRVAELRGIERYQLRDTRDTCVTRLFAAGVTLGNIPPWTGHSQRDAESILRRHYIELLDEGAHETARTYLKYAAVQGFDIGTKGA